MGKKAMIPFQAGRRICLGKKMAMLEAKAILLMLVKEFKFELVKNQKIRRMPSLTIFAEPPGIMFNIKKRE